jgi:hypothetical protein
MKWYYWLAIAVGIIFSVRAWKNSPTRTAPADRPKTPEEKAADMGKADNGAISDPALYHLADQQLYPGYYTTKYGGYYNPDTGQSFSPGSSPPVQGLSAYDAGTAVRAVVDPNVRPSDETLAKTAPAAETAALGYNTVY